MPGGLVGCEHAESHLHRGSLPSGMRYHVASGSMAIEAWPALAAAGQPAQAHPPPRYAAAWPSIHSHAPSSFHLSTSTARSCLPDPATTLSRRCHPAAGRQPSPPARSLAHQHAAQALSAPGLLRGRARARRRRSWRPARRPALRRRPPGTGSGGAPNSGASQAAAPAPAGPWRAAAQRARRRRPGCLAGRPAGGAAPAGFCRASAAASGGSGRGEERLGALQSGRFEPKQTAATRAPRCAGRPSARQSDRPSDARAHESSAAGPQQRAEYTRASRWLCAPRSASAT
jgi:hypothetical protein